MIRWYVWPLQVIEGGTYAQRRGPKYLYWTGNRDGIKVPWRLIDYGLMPTALLVADVTPEQHELAASRPDIVAIPEDIDSQIGGHLSAVVSALEDLRIPADWVTETHTYRDVMRKVAHLFQFAQRYSARTAKRLIEEGYNLSTRIDQLPAAARTSLNETAQDLGWDTSGISPTWTVRRALGYLADQWGDAPILVGAFGEL